jgi:hypothetical protein
MMVSLLAIPVRILSLLEEEWAKEKGRLIVVYGRRRIGKKAFFCGKAGEAELPRSREPITCA